MSEELDNWGIRPAPRGTVRGKIGNVRLSRREAAYGEMTIYEFDLLPGEGKPPVAVRMEGNDFMNTPQDGWLADVLDPTPAIRPIETRVMRLPFGDGSFGELRSFYPGRDAPSRTADRNWTISALVLPGVFAFGVAALIFWYFGLHGGVL